MNGPYIPIATTLGLSSPWENATLGVQYFVRVTPRGLGGIGGSLSAFYIPAGILSSFLFYSIKFIVNLLTVAPDVIGPEVVVTNVMDISMRIVFPVPFNGGVPLKSFNVITLQEDTVGNKTIYNQTFSAKYPKI